MMDKGKIGDVAVLSLWYRLCKVNTYGRHATGTSKFSRTLIL